MGFFQSKKRQSREPNETARLTQNVEAVLWRSKSEKGGLSIAIGLNRLDDEGNQRRTFRPEHLPQLAEAIAILAMSLAKAPGIDRAVGSMLSELGRDLGKVVETSRGNGLAVTETDSENDSLLG